MALERDPAADRDLVALVERVVFHGDRSAVGRLHDKLHDLGHPALARYRELVGTHVLATYHFQIRGAGEATLDEHSDPRPVDGRALKAFREEVLALFLLDVYTAASVCRSIEAEPARLGFSAEWVDLAGPTSTTTPDAAGHP